MLFNVIRCVVVSSASITEMTRTIVTKVLRRCAANELVGDVTHVCKQREGLPHAMFHV